VVVRAAAAAPTKVAEKQYKLGGKFDLKVIVEDDGETQRVKLTTEHPGRPLLHWGVKGGLDYQGGWRLPGDEARPQGTVAYKSRALQTPFRDEDGQRVLEVVLTGDERSDSLVFVVKEGTTWYDKRGDNFEIPLKAAGEKEAAPREVPEPPAELCGIWAYIQWENQGCPNRSSQESDAEYQSAIKELRSYLAEGVSLDELWQVAKGQKKYADFKGQRGGQQQQSQEADIELDPELVGLKAYLLWEENGRPEGGDFSQQAREVLTAAVRSGKSIKEVERAMPFSPLVRSQCVHIVALLLMR